MTPVRLSLDEASAEQVEELLRRCDSRFVPPLSERLDIAAYARKICYQATRFEAWVGGVLVGLVATYLNDPAAGVAFVTNVSVLPGWTRRGIASDLMRRCIARVSELNFKHLTLEVSPLNEGAVRLYQQLGFVSVASEPPAQTMRLDLSSKGGERYA